MCLLHVLEEECIQDLYISLKITFLTLINHMG